MASNNNFNVVVGVIGGLISIASGLLNVAQSANDVKNQIDANQRNK